MIRMLAPITALLFSVGLLLAGNGLQTTLLPIRGNLEGFSPFTLGLMGSSYYGGFALGCLLVPFAVVVAGHIRAFTAMVSLASAAALLHPLIVDPVAWCLFRLVAGFCLAGIYLIVESWLNDQADNANRGFIMSAYIFVVFAMQTVGQMIVVLGDPTSFPLFAIASILVSLAVIPVAMTRSAQPAPITIVRIRFFSLYRISPVGFVGAVVSGMSLASLWALGTVYATLKGFSTDTAAYFLSAAVAGGTLAQWPVGRLSDRMDRRRVMLAIMGLAGLFGLILAIFNLPQTLLLITAGLFGAALLPMYSLAAAHTYDHVESDAFVEVAAGVILANSVGAVIGPLIASKSLDMLGPGGLFYAIAAFMAAMIGFTVFRMNVSPRVAADERTDFEVYATAPAGAVVTPEPLEEDSEYVVVPEAWTSEDETDVQWKEGEDAAGDEEEAAPAKATAAAAYAVEDAEIVEADATEGEADPKAGKEAGEKTGKKNDGDDPDGKDSGDKDSGDKDSGDADTLPRL